jgi:small subunit ribosomal protein S4
MLRKRKKYERPKTPFDKPRILEENKLVTKYGLKNKKEIWKAESRVKYFRTRAKTLITADPEEQKAFFDKLNKIGLKVENVSDVLALDKEALLKRRLPTVLVEKKIATKPKQARQMVVHKRVLVKGRVVNVPSYLVHVDEEKSITVRNKVRKMKPKIEEPKAEEVKEETAEPTEEVKDDNSDKSTEETPNA